MGKVLIDTNIVIELFKGNVSVKDTLDALDNVKVSAITVMELYYGAFNRDEVVKIKRGLRPFFIEPMTPVITEKAIHLVETYAKSHSLAIPDALIAATCIITNEALYTLNTRDFRFIEELDLVDL
jgi:tRNA(fMet)-specific endonuclease VapC